MITQANASVSNQIDYDKNIFEESPTGSVNGANKVFTLANTPYNSRTVRVYVNSLRLMQGAGKDYTISGAVITLAAAPSSGQNILVDYMI
jgi:hypothetical protein